MEEVEPVPDIDLGQVLATRLQRSTLWDMVGPYNMRDTPGLYGQNPASTDVLEREAVDMWERKHALIPFGENLPMLCSIAAHAATRAIMVGEGMQLSPEQQMNLTMNNTFVSMRVAQSVIGHMLQAGMITYGGRNELLGS